MNKNKLKDKVQSIVLVVLFFSTILLLYFLWEGSSIRSLSLPTDVLFPAETAAELPEISTLIEPCIVQVNFGSDSYTVFSANSNALWSSFIEDYNKFSKSENVFIEEITSQQWEESMKFKSIQYKFNYALPFSEYFESVGSSKVPQFDSIKSFSIIAYSLASKVSLFVYDSVTDKYYRLISEKDRTSLSAQIDALSEVSHEQYYPINSFFGVKNDTLLPFAVKTSLRSIPTESEMYNLDQHTLNTLAEDFYGESLDFIRKITEDDGSIIYMYGYGQKILRFQKDNMLEYKEELTASSYVETSYLDALSIANVFVATHGNWSSLEGDSIVPYLRSAEGFTSDKKTGYRFNFGLKQDNYPVFYEEGAPIVVEVFGSQVSYYKRQLFIPTSLGLEPSTLEIYPIMSVLPTQYLTIRKILYDSGVPVEGFTSDEVFNSIASHITGVDTCYFKKSGDGVNTMIPAWIVCFSNLDIFFDLYTGEYLGYSDDRRR